MILIVSIPDICVLPHFLYSHEYRLTRNTVYYAILSDQIVVGCPLGVPISYYLFPKLQSHLCGPQYGSNGGVIEAVNEYFGGQEKAFFLRDKKARTEMG